MRPKWGGGEEKKERKEKEEKGLFFIRRGSFLKTASNYSAFHIRCTPGSFALYLEPSRSWPRGGGTEADANGPEFRGLGATRG